MKRIQRLSLLLGPLLVALMLANMIAGISPVEAARKTKSSAVTPAAVCPTDASAITSMSVRITRGGSSFIRSNLSEVQPGDTVKVTFDLNDACTNYKVSLVSYKAADDSNNLETLYLRQVHSSQSLYFGNAGGSLQVTVPSCYFATVFAVGSVLTSMSSTKLYGTRQKDLKNGGASACAGIVPPSSAPIFYYEGNPTCAELGADFGETWNQFKIDGIPANGTLTFEGSQTLTISGSNNKNLFNWASSVVMRGVFVKASSGGNLYRYASGATGDSGMYSVAKPDGSGQMYDISHVSFCYKPLPTTTVCPSGKSAITSYRFEIWRGGVKTDATDLNNVRQGDLVKAFFDLAPNCSNIRLSIAAYEAAEPFYDVNTIHLQRYMPYAGDTGLFNASQSDSQRMVQTLVPGCNFQVDFVYGEIIPNLSPTNLYGARKIAWKNGGSGECAWNVTPTSTGTVNPTSTLTNSQKTQTALATTPSPTVPARVQPTQTPNMGATQTAVVNVTQTAVANQTGTVVAKTATTIANQTGTAVAKTATTIANQTGTVVAMTATTIANQTATSVSATQTSVAATITAQPGATQTAIAAVTETARANVTGTAVAHVTETAGANQTGTAIAATTTSVAGVTETAQAHVTETASAVAATETAAAQPTSTNTPAPTATAVDGTLRIHKRDQDGLALYGACFQVTGPGFNDEFCDDDGIDTDPLSGELRLLALLAGTYAVQETAPPADYIGDDTVYNVVVPNGGTGEVTIFNTLDTTEPETDVFLYKLNCQSQPSSINPVTVALGTMPADGDCVFAPAGVKFDIRDQFGVVIHSGVTTDGGGLVNFTIATSVTSITVFEYPESNPLMQPPPPSGFEFGDIHCPCGYSELVVVNIADTP